MQPGIDQLLIASALDPDLRRRLLEIPDEVFAGFDLTEDEQDILRHPDQRLLPLLGGALARQSASSAPAPEPPASAPQPHAVADARTLPDISLALTLVPCAQYENGRFVKFAYAVWVNPLPEGVDPASLPPPQGAVLPGQPLPPLHAVIQVCAVHLRDAVGLCASLRQSSNISAPAPPEMAGDPAVSPFASDLRSEGVQAAIAAVRRASKEERYGRVLDLLRSLRSGDVV